MCSPEDVAPFETKPVPLVVFGEVLHDCFPGGARVLGGAPFNVAWGLKGLGCDPLFVSAVGEDASGREIRRRMQAWGMDLSGLQSSVELSTGEVQVSIEGDVPRYAISSPRAWDAIEDPAVVPTGLLYHGALALRSETSRRSFDALRQRSSGLRFFDLNLRPPHYDLDRLKGWVEGADWLKLNIDELRELLGSKAIEFEWSATYLDRLRAMYSVENVVLTGGSQGALIRGSYGFWVQFPAPSPKGIVDTVGAGDAFSAVTIDGILSGMSAREIVERAGQFAAKVCAIPGATTLNPEFYKLKNDA